MPPSPASPFPFCVPILKPSNPHSRFMLSFGGCCCCCSTWKGKRGDHIMKHLFFATPSRRVCFPPASKTSASSPPQGLPPPPPPAKRCPAFRQPCNRSLLAPPPHPGCCPGGFSPPRHARGLGAMLREGQGRETPARPARPPCFLSRRRQASP